MTTSLAAKAGITAQTCATCGILAAHRVVDLAPHPGKVSVALWHLAPCGAPCIGGGIRTMEGESWSGYVNRTHRATACSIHGCPGGKPS